MGDFTLTEEQARIINFFPKLVGKNDTIMGVRAFAGTGKSFLLKQAAKTYPNLQMLGLAFNNSIATENKRSFPKKNTKWFTVHGFAKEYLKKELMRLEKEVERGAMSERALAESGYRIDFSSVMPDLKPIEIIDALDIKDKGDYALAKAIADVFKVYCQSALQDIAPEGIRGAARAQLDSVVIALPDAYIEAGCHYSKQLWEKHKKGEIPPTFNYYLKFFEVSGIARRITDFDILLIDEAQDSNYVTLSIAKQLPCPIVAVGDEHQSIYGFRGTLNLLSMTDHNFYLSSTFRYIPKIADTASKILKTYKGEKVPIRSFAKEAPGGIDQTIAYLSRNNSTMIGIIDQLVKKNKMFRTVKKPEELFAASLALLEVRLEGRTEAKGFSYLNQFGGNMESIKDYIDEAGDMELKTAFSMQRRYGKRLYALLKIAKENYRNKSDNCSIILSTAHTSKGLEWDAVELLNDFPDIPRLLRDANIKNSKELMERMGDGDPVAYGIAQEVNLLYVAVTRARFHVANRHIDEEEAA